MAPKRAASAAAAAPLPKRAAPQERREDESPYQVYKHLYWLNREASHAAAELHAASAGLWAYYDPDNRTPEARLAALRRVMTTILTDCGHHRDQAGAADLVAAVFSQLPHAAKPHRLVAHLRALSQEFRRDDLSTVCAGIMHVSVVPDDAEYVVWLQRIAEAFRYPHPHRETVQVVQEWVKGDPSNELVANTISATAVSAIAAYAEYFRILTQ